MNAATSWPVRQRLPGPPADDRCLPLSRRAHTSRVYSTTLLAGPRTGLATWAEDRGPSALDDPIELGATSRAGLALSAINEERVGRARLLHVDQFRPRFFFER